MTAGGCFTAHQADVKLDIRNHRDNQPVEDCLLLAVRMESMERKGYWWVAQEEAAGPMVPRQAEVVTIRNGENLHQRGQVVTTIGPYATGYAIGYEYWLFRNGYQPDDFMDMHVERAYEDKRPLELRLLVEDPGSVLSDEKTLDGARRFVEVAEFLPADDAQCSRLLALLTRQVQAVMKNSYKPKFRDQAKELLQPLATLRKRFPFEDSALPPLPTPAPTTAPASRPGVQTHGLEPIRKSR